MLHSKSIILTLEIWKSIKKIEKYNKKPFSLWPSDSWEFSVKGKTTSAGGNVAEKMDKYDEKRDPALSLRR